MISKRQRGKGAEIAVEYDRKKHWFVHTVELGYKDIVGTCIISPYKRAVLISEAPVIRRFMEVCVLITEKIRKK